VLATIIGGEAAMGQRILQDYRRLTDDDAVSLRQAIGSGDGATVARMAHRIKGASSSVGAHEMARVCDRLERAGHALNWKSVEMQMVRFEAEWGRLTSDLDAP
jgi:HPt (histidine-containing phosphotransfer) domain-containing protein